MSDRPRVVFLERMLSLQVVGNRRGHIIVTGDVCGYHGRDIRLVFELDIDQTSLPGIINDLDSVLRYARG